ncbi:MAG: elongation factor 4 [Candidatus Coatesbacteria bacterium]|nr:MAG: elongation factor 4 [Candidatus Coatesbacteria bacterium]
MVEARQRRSRRLSAAAYDRDRIRNFSIIAHIDHGKSTLSDRFIELTGALPEREMAAQVLDTMDLERERGITIKAQTVRLNYRSRSGQGYVFNLIDTPGHVDFTYEVSRSLAACDGALLVVDAAQGVEAQTVANLYLALENDLQIIPVINKIDLPSADVEETRRQIADVLGLEPGLCVPVSAKTGEGVKALFEAIIEHIPAPKGEIEAPFRALVFDSFYEQYHGVVAVVRVMDGAVAVGQRISFMSTGNTFEVQQLGWFSPKATRAETLRAGEVGFVLANIKNVSDSALGDTITLASRPASKPLPGYVPVKQVVFSGLFPLSTQQFEDLQVALEKLSLNDPAFIYEPESSSALGLGFRCGFLGTLHMEIVRERLEREFGLQLLSTAPNVVYEAILMDGSSILVDSPNDMPPTQKIDHINEPFIRCTIIVPDEFIGNILKLLTDRRGTQKSMEYVGAGKVMLVYELPFNETLFDFYDKLKSASKGYASYDYEHIGRRASEIVKVDILINGQAVDALSFMTHKQNAYRRGVELVRRIRKQVPRQLFEVVIQAAIGSKIISRERVAPLRKNVTAKCYGGDITRKRKLLEKQKEGKRKMKQLGSVAIPQEAFMEILKVD